MKRKVSMTKAIEQAKAQIFKSGPSLISVYDTDMKRKELLTIPASAQSVYYLRNLRLKRVLELMYGEGHEGLSDVIASQPGSLREVVKWAIADIEYEQLSQYRIENIQIVKYANKEQKSFKAYELKNNAYVYIGSFLAPHNTKNKDLHNFIV